MRLDRHAIDEGAVRTVPIGQCVGVVIKPNRRMVSRSVGVKNPQAAAKAASDVKAFVGQFETFALFGTSNHK